MDILDIDFVSEITIICPCCGKDIPEGLTHCEDCTQKYKPEPYSVLLELVK